MNIIVSRKKKLVTVIIGMCFILGTFFSSTVFGGTYDEEIYDYKTLTNDCTIKGYKTQGGGEVKLVKSNLVATTFPQLSGYRIFLAEDKENWVFKGWTYSLLFKGNDLGNRKTLQGFTFSASDSWGKPYNGTDKLISVNRLATVGEIAGIPLKYQVVANYNPTILATAGEGGTISDLGRVEIDMGDSRTYNIEPDEGYLIKSVSVDGVEQEVATEYTFNDVIEPRTISVEFIRAFTVTYKDGIEGEVFPEQSYFVSENSPTPAFVGELIRDGYKFIGWEPEIAETVTEDVAYVAKWQKEKTVPENSGENTNQNKSEIKSAKAVNTGDGNMLAGFTLAFVLALTGLVVYAKKKAK